MIKEQPSDIVHRFVNEFKNGGGSLAPLDELLDASFVHHLPAPDLPPGIPGFKAIAGSIFAAFPHVHVTAELVILKEIWLQSILSCVQHTRTLFKASRQQAGKWSGQRTTFIA